MKALLSAAALISAWLAWFILNNSREAFLTALLTCISTVGFIGMVTYQLVTALRTAKEAQEALCVTERLNRTSSEAHSRAGRKQFGREEVSAPLEP